MSSSKENYVPKTLGFCGLGAMGAPMVGHLASKLPDETQIYVFDVAEAMMDQVCRDHSRLLRAKNGQDVADKSVRYRSTIFPLDTAPMILGYGHHD